MIGLELDIKKLIIKLKEQSMLYHFNSLGDFNSLDFVIFVTSSVVRSTVEYSKNNNILVNLVN